VIAAIIGAMPMIVITRFNGWDLCSRRWIRTGPGRLLATFSRRCARPFTPRNWIQELAA
jgi:hypothetical protein